MLLLIDNYDSFVHNLARYLRRLGTMRVVRNDQIDAAEVRRLRPDALVLSPGPCTPNEAGSCLDLVRQFYQQLPMLGVCLGHQAIVQALGGRVISSPHPMHGRSCRVLHDGQGVFAGLPQPITACRYHSLVVDRQWLPDSLNVTATSEDDQCVMAVQHRSLPVVGLQFHPESVLTPNGYQLLANFLALAAIPGAGEVPSLYDERPPEPVAAEPPDMPPISF